MVKGRRPIRKNTKTYKTTRPARGKGRASRGRRVARPARTPTEKKEPVVLDLDVNKNATEFFTKNATYDQHYDAQNSNRDKYVATVMAFDDYSIEMIPNAKARSLAAAFARRDKNLIEFYLNHNKNKFGFVDVLKAITILDSDRERRAIEKKIERVAKSGKVMKSKKMGVLKRDINNLTKMKPKVGTLSGALARHLKRWVNQFTEKDLEFFALCFPTDPWKKLANLIHLNPTKDLAAAWFLPYCFGGELPKDSKIEKCRNMTQENVNELVAEYNDLPYSLIKKFKDGLNDKSKEIIAQRQEKLDTILWYYEDLACKAVDDIIRARLENGDKIELGYGKLMERLLMFKDLNKAKSINEIVESSLFSLLIKIAERDLANFKATLASPVAVLGDASGSMEVAIRTSTIISSLLATICQAKLTFFNHSNFEAKKEPKNVADVLDVAYNTKASGSTAPAASLVPYYDNKEVIKTFIIVTDEEENANATTNEKSSYRFFELFMEYRKKVYPASLIFVSFLGSQHSEGQMYRQFVKENVPDVIQFKFDRARPDLTKLDSILGSICSKSSTTFAGHVEKLESDIKEKGIIEAFKNLKPISDGAVSAQETDKKIVY